MKVRQIKLAEDTKAFDAAGAVRTAESQITKAASDLQDALHRMESALLQLRDNKEEAAPECRTLIEHLHRIIERRNASDFGGFHIGISRMLENLRWL